jgi:hypothetical protein
MTLTFKENSNLVNLVNIKGTEIKASAFTKEQLDSLEDYLNYKLHELKWWDNCEMKPSGRILLSAIMKDNDAFFVEFPQADGSKVYQFLSDCDRYIFEANILFNNANEFYFIEEYCDY